MLNVDKYREYLLEEIKTRETVNKENNDENSAGLVYFDSIEAVKRKYGGGESLYFSDDVKWLFTEYEPPLLENGDNLNSGDWIMVRNNKDNEWEKFRFVCYHNDAFWTLYDDGDWFYTGLKIKPWNQARLPMEGE